MAFLWHGSAEDKLLVAVNYAANQSQCFVRLPFFEFRDNQWRLEDLLSAARYDRNGNDLESRGLYLDLGPWDYHAFKLL